MRIYFFASVFEFQNVPSSSLCELIGADLSPISNGSSGSLCELIGADPLSIPNGSSRAPTPTLFYPNMLLRLAPFCLSRIHSIFCP